MANFIISAMEDSALALGHCTIGLVLLDLGYSFGDRPIVSNKTLKYLVQNSNKILFVHYSCQSFTDKNQELSPRITSIAALFNNGRILKSFSIHYTAEILHIDRDDIEKNYNAIENVMLSDFFKFAESQYDYIWLHWNMVNINYGFEALEHRYKVLTGNDAYKISEESKYNLSKLILNKYGKDCVDDPKMYNLMDLNGGVHRDFLSGADEVRAFENKDYLKMHKSTMCKVYWFPYIFNLLIKNKVKTNKYNLNLILDRIFEKPLIKIFSLIAMMVTIITGVVVFCDFLVKRISK